jgi:hypothetical protein
MRGAALAVASLCMLLCVAPELSAWDLFGHHVTGAIAWDHMTPATRKAVTELLLEAPPDSNLPRLLPPGPRPFDVRARELFLKAQGWADLVRDEVWSHRKERYDHPTWHYVNRFWTTDGSGPRWLPERGTLGELVQRLEESEDRMTSSSVPASERAIALAWVLHLAGDVHQPLHSSARVTSRDPNGDRGGNDFELDDEESPNLHAYWDSIFRRARRQYHSEGYFAWVSRVARELEGLHPASSLEREIAESSPESWSKEAAVIAMNDAYPNELVRGAAPPRHYQVVVFERARRQAALAGYRLARLLNERFGDS